MTKLLRRLPAALLAIVFFVGLMADGKAADSDTVTYGEPRQIGVVNDDRLAESSGLASSILNPGFFWTHNDSGDLPRLFLIDRKGNTLAMLTVEGARATDWEDIASFRKGKDSYLIIGDVGDNRAKRQQHMLYIVKEPRIGREPDPRVSSLKLSMAVPFIYEDGPHNCESVAVDPTGHTIYLIGKEKGTGCKVYRLAWPIERVTQPLTARTVATLEIPQVTGMDISPDGRRAIVLTYTDAYEYARGANETWDKAFARKGRRLPMPMRRQGESICYGLDGKTLYLTSEGKEQPLWEVPVAPGSATALHSPAEPPGRLPQD